MECISILFNFIATWSDIWNIVNGRERCVPELRGQKYSDCRGIKGAVVWKFAPALSDWACVTGVDEDE